MSTTLEGINHQLFLPIMLKGNKKQPFLTTLSGLLYV